MDETFDFVIVGSGGGSMCAALMMRSAGKSVAVLEKTDLIGGTTSVSGGLLWIPDNRFMKEKGIPDSPEAAMAYLDAVVGDSPDTPAASRVRRQAYVDQSNRMLEFLIGQGIKLRGISDWPDYYDAPGASVPGRTVCSRLFDVGELGEWKDRIRPFLLPMPVYMDEAVKLPHMKRSWASKKLLPKVAMRVIASKITGKKLITGGSALQSQLLKASVKVGADVRVNSPVKELIVEDGRVTGVVVERDGKVQRIGARAGVLLNAGGFTRNQAMRDRFIPGTSADWTFTGPGDTGEMIEQGEKIGAALVQMDARVGGQLALPPGGRSMMQGDVSKPHSIVVDQSGARFQDEAGSYTDFSDGMLRRNKEVPAVPSFMILDSQYLAKFMFAGTMPGTRKPDAWFEQGFLLQADSIEDLAKACGIDPEALRQTVDRFNGFARAGHDEDFHRGDSAYDRWLGDPADPKSPSLGTIEQGPFYAVRIYPGDVGTFGGLLTDEYARVLREDGSVIPGLYATGTTAASAMGKVSPAAGVNVGQSFTWGYVAAKHAANLDNAAA